MPAIRQERWVEGWGPACGGRHGNGERSGGAAGFGNPHEGPALGRRGGKENGPVRRPRASSKYALEIADRLGLATGGIHLLQLSTTGESDKAAVGRPKQKRTVPDVLRAGKSA